MTMARRDYSSQTEMFSVVAWIVTMTVDCSAHADHPQEQSGACY